MNARSIDIAIVGGGLAGGLAALALTRKRPELPIVLIEAGETLGGNHRWSWFATDLPEGGEALLEPIRKTEWNAGYDVRFPGRSRTLETPYRSMSSTDFAAALERALPDGTIRTAAPVAEIDANGVTLETGEHIAARLVIDCRGAQPSPDLCGGWQVFMGRHLRTAEAHGIDRPVIMDATVDQHDAYRFVYVLPLGAFDLFVEDTYYADSPALDRAALSARIDAYCSENGWADAAIVGHETGVLPVITGGVFAAFQDAARSPGVTVAGARGGFVHPLTSYTLPFAVQTALILAEEADLPGNQLTVLLETAARKHWKDTKFYRKLGSMLFGAPKPDERWRVFERFYGLPEPLIERFYAARSTAGDRRRILCGKPPVPVTGAVRAMLTARPPMAARQAT